MAPDEQPPRKERKKGEEGEEEGDPGSRQEKGSNGNGKRLSRDFKDRWKKVESSEEVDEPKEEPQKPALGLFKRKLMESKEKKVSGFSGLFGPPQSDRKMGKKEKEPSLKGPEKLDEKDQERGTDRITKEPAELAEPSAPTEKPDVLDSIIFELRGKKEEFIQRRKEELKREAERPQVDTTPYLSKLAIIKEEMEKKKKEKTKPDLFGVGFTAEVMESRTDVMDRDEERMKADLKVVMERTMKEGSVVRRLEEALAQPIEAIEDEQEAARERILEDIRKMEAKGFEGRISKILSKVKAGKAFQAESDLVNVKIAMEAQRSREQLKREREERLEASLEGGETEEFDLDHIVDRHVKAIEIEMDQTKARINRDLRKMETTGFEHVVRDITEMMEDGRAFDAEEQLLELRLALKARELREDLKRKRESSIMERAHVMMPSLPRADADPDEIPVEELEVVEDEVGVVELEPVQEEEPAEEVQEVQCGICGTIIPEGASTCPACGTSFGPEGEDLSLPGEPTGPGRPPRHPEVTEVLCGVCGALVPPGAGRCRACGTALTAEVPVLEEVEDEHPELVPVEEEYPELAPFEEGEGYPELVPVLEEVPEVSPELVPVDEAEAYPSLVPEEEVRCHICDELMPASLGYCEKCGAPLGEIPTLVPEEVEGDLPELVPIGPWETVTEEVSIDEEGIPVMDMTEDIEVTAELVPELETVEDEEAAVVSMDEVECGICGNMVEASSVTCPGCGAFMVEAVPWAEEGEVAEEDIEWRRLCIRGKRLFEEGRVKEALEAYDEALGIKSSFEAYHGKGNALLTLGWSNSALDCFNRSIEVDGTRTNGWLMKAKALESLGRYEEAVESIDKALTMEPESAEAWHMKGTMLMQMGRVKEAVEALDKWVSVKPTESVLEEAVSLTKKAMAEMATVEEGADVQDELRVLEEEELRAAKAVRYRRITRPKGLTNGLALINGRGLVNGRALTNGRRSLVNGRRTGMVNGRAITNGLRAGVTNGVTKGLINGRGLVNGASGLVNGRAIADARDGEPVIRFKRKKRQRNVIIAGAVIAMALLFIVPAFQYMMIQTPEGITIDGQFDDWSDITRYEDPLGDQATSNDLPYNRDVDIISYAMNIDTRAISFYVRVPPDTKMLRGEGQGVDVVNFFIDIDSSYATGYHIKGMGADYRLEAFGWDNKVHSAGLYVFNTSEDRSNEDWNGWLPGPSIKARSLGSELEVQVPRAELLPHTSNQVLGYVHMSDEARQQDFSDWIISKVKGVLDVEYSALNEGIIIDPDTTNNPFLKIDLTAQRSVIEVEAITIQRVGKVRSELGIGDVRLWMDRGDLTNGDGQFDPAIDTELGQATFTGSSVDLTFTSPIIVQQDQTITLFATIDILSTVTLYQTIGLDLDRTDIKVTKGTVTVKKVNPAISYIGPPSPEIIIDGSFDDWEFVQSHSDTDDLRELVPDNVDLRDYRSHFDESTVSFYLSTEDDIMSGMVVPSTERTRPAPGPSNQTNVTPGPPVGPPDLPELTGADIVVILIDTDQDPTTGYRYGIPIGAEFKVLIEGKDGEVISQELYRFVGMAGGGQPWEEVSSAKVPAANDRYRIETQVSRTILGIDPFYRIDAFFFIIDWEGRGDSSDTALSGDRGQLDVKGIDVIPDTVKPGTIATPLLGIEMSATSIDIILRGLSVTRFGNATDQDTGKLHIYMDNGDRAFTPLDLGNEMGEGRFDQGDATLVLDPPRTIISGAGLVVFLTADITVLGEGRTMGVTIERDDVVSTADRVSGAFPISSLLTTITTEDDRGTNYTVDYDDGKVDEKDWKNANEARIDDPTEKGIDDHEDIDDARVSDDTIWLNFFVKTKKDLWVDVHVYIDVDGDGNADFDLVFDYDNSTVILFSFDGTNWNEVDLVDDDRCDLQKGKLEMGIELSYLDLDANQTINYYVTTEDDLVPDGEPIDRGPDDGWSDDYVTIPEFQDVIIPLVGSLLLFTLLRRGGRRRGRSKGVKRKVGGRRRDLVGRGQGG